MKATFAPTVFDILLLESRLVLVPAQWGIRSHRVNTADKLLPQVYRKLIHIFIVFVNKLKSKTIENISLILWKKYLKHFYCMLPYYFVENLLPFSPANFGYPTNNLFIIIFSHSEWSRSFGNSLFWICNYLCGVYANRYIKMDRSNFCTIFKSHF